MKYAGLAAYILVVALFFGAGFAVGSVNGRKTARESLEQTAASEPTAAVNASARTETEPETEYTVILENGALAVYETKGVLKTRIAEHKISEAVFPGDDIAALKKGMVFADKNAAMAMFENFAS